MRQKIFGFLIATILLAACATTGTENKPVQPVANPPTAYKYLWSAYTHVNLSFGILAWIAQDTAVAIGRSDEKVYIVDPATRAVTQTIPAMANAISTGKNTNRVLITSGNVASVWDSATGNKLAAWNFQVNNLYQFYKGMAISNDGTFVLIGNNNKIYKYLVDQPTLSPEVLIDDQGAYFSNFKISPDNKYFLYNEAFDFAYGLTGLHETTGSAPAKTLCGYNYAWSADSQSAVMVCGYQINKFFVADSSLVSILPAIEIHNVVNLKLYNGGQVLDVAHPPINDTHTEELYDLTNQQLLGATRTYSRVSKFSFEYYPPVFNNLDATMKVLRPINDSEFSIKQIDLINPNLVTETTYSIPNSFTTDPHKTNVYNLAWSPDGLSVASAGRDGTVKIWDGSTGLAVNSFEADSGKVYAVAWKPDGSVLASAGDDGVIKLWNKSTFESVGKLLGHTYTVRSLAWSPDGTKLVSASWDGTVRVWDSSTLQELAKLTSHTDYVNTVVFSPDGTKFATASSDKTIKIWDAKTNLELRTITGATESVFALAWSSDGTMLASGGNDKYIRIYNPNTGVLIKNWKAHYDAVRGLQWVNGGTALVSISQDSSLRTWSPQGVPLLDPIDFFGSGLFGLALNPTGTKISVSTDNAVIQTYEVK